MLTRCLKSAVDDVRGWDKMEKPLFQFGLLTLVSGAVMAGILLGANLVERKYMEQPASTDPVTVPQTQVEYGWPYNAVHGYWSQWHPGDPKEPRNWFPLTILYRELIIDIGLCLTVLIAGTYSVEWLVRTRGGTLVTTKCRGFNLVLLALLMIILQANCRRPLYWVDRLIGVGWGWPQAFIQISADSEIVLFAVFPLLADLVFGFAVIGIAGRLGVWMFRHEGANSPEDVHVSPGS